MSATRAGTRRVLFLAWAPFFSGAERALVRALQGLNPARYEPFVVVGTDGELASQLRSMGVSHQVAPVRPLDRRSPLAGVCSVAAIFGAARRHRVSLIHANDVPSFQPGGYVARALGIPAIAHVRFPDTLEGYRWFLRSRFALALFVSEEQRRAAVEVAPELFARRSEVLHDCADYQGEWTPDERLRVRRDLGLSEQATVIAIAGQVAEIKGIWDFVEAARIMVGRGSSAEFVVLGDDLKTSGLVRRDMQERVTALGLGARFTFLGFRPDASRLAQAFDVIAVPSHVEPFGLAALEGSAAGRAVVASQVGGLPEIVVDRETGLIVPPREPASLASALETLVNDPALRAGIGSAGRRRAREKFSIEAYGPRLEAIYDRLCSSPALAAGAENMEPV